MLTLRRAVSEGCTANKILTLKEKIMNIFLKAVQGVWKHAALCLQLQRKATVLPKVFQGRVQIIYFFVLLCTPIVGRECKFPDRYSIYFHRDYKCK